MAHCVFCFDQFHGFLLLSNIESCLQDSPPAAGRFRDILPCRRSAIPRSIFYITGNFNGISCYIKNPPFVSEKADFLYIKNTLSLSLPKTGFSISAPFQITECRSVSAAAWLLIKSSRELLMFAVSYHEIHGSLVHLTDWIF